MNKELTICCLNCHYYLSNYENCQGLEDIENYCHEYKETLYQPETKNMEKDGEG